MIPLFNFLICSLFLSSSPSFSCFAFVFLGAVRYCCRVFLNMGDIFNEAITPKRRRTDKYAINERVRVLELKGVLFFAKSFPILSR